MEPKSPSKVKFSVIGLHRNERVLRLSIPSFLILFLPGCGFWAFKWINSPSLIEKDSYYTVVVDCGSTGTRINVYKWKIRSSNNWDLPVLEHSYPDGSTDQSLFSKYSCKYHCLQTEPGLDKFVGNVTAVRISLEPLILLAEQWVPVGRHGETPIFVLATAGLRRLPVEDATKVLDDVEHVLKVHSFVYRRSWIRVLSGKEEAYCGWVALNFQMGYLGNSSRGSTLGLLDLGGSSLQVVMEVGIGARNDTHLIRTKIGSVKHEILAYSLSLFGLNEAFDRTIAMLRQLQPSKGSPDERHIVRHPCLRSSFAQNYTCYACDGLNMTYQKNLKSQKHKSEDIYLVGEPDWEQCRGLATAVACNSSGLDGLQPTIHADCKTSLSSYNGNRIFNLAAATTPTRRFHALSGFFAVHNMLELAPQANLTLIWEKGEKLCSKSWEDLSNTPGNQNSLGQYCFRVPYMASLIQDALCLGDSEIIFGPGDLSWTLGAALIEGEYLWLNSFKTNISSSTKIMKVIIYSPIFVFLLLLFLSLLSIEAKLNYLCWERRLPPLGHLYHLTYIQSGVQINVKK